MSVCKETQKRFMVVGVKAKVNYENKEKSFTRILYGNGSAEHKTFSFSFVPSSALTASHSNYFRSLSAHVKGIKCTHKNSKNLSFISSSCINHKILRILINSSLYFLFSSACRCSGENYACVYMPIILKWWWWKKKEEKSIISSRRRTCINALYVHSRRNKGIEKKLMS